MRNNNKSKIDAQCRRGSVGSFFLGGLFGFIVCVFVLCVVGAFVYFKATPNWVNKTFKTDIEVTDEIGNMTIADVVQKSRALLINKEIYSLTNLKNDFGIDLIKQIKDDTSVDLTELKNVAIIHLPEELKNLHLASIMGYQVKNGEVFEDKDNDGVFTDKVYGVTANFAKKKISEMNSMDEVFEGLKVKDLLEFDIDLTKYFDAETEIENITTAIEDMKLSQLINIDDSATGVLKALKDVQIKNLFNKIENLTVADFFDASERTGVLSLIDANSKITDLADSLETAITTKTLNDLVNAGIFDVNNEDLTKQVPNKYIARNKKVGELTINELINLAIATTSE